MSESAKKSPSPKRAKPHASKGPKSPLGGSICFSRLDADMVKDLPCEIADPALEFYTTFIDKHCPGADRPAADVDPDTDTVKLVWKDKAKIEFGPLWVGPRYFVCVSVTVPYAFEDCCGLYRGNPGDPDCLDYGDAWVQVTVAKGDEPEFLKATTIAVGRTADGF